MTESIVKDLEIIDAPVEGFVARFLKAFTSLLSKGLRVLIDLSLAPTLRTEVLSAWITKPFSLFTHPLKK
jgi:hypothetical protein